MGCITSGNAGGRPPLWFTALAVILTGVLTYRLKIDITAEDLKGSKHFMRPPTDADMPENTPALEAFDAWEDVDWESPTAPRHSSPGGVEVME